jgi:hypothetical protein
MLKVTMYPHGICKDKKTGSCPIKVCKFSENVSAEKL